MRLSSTILALLMASGPEISIYDSKTHSGKSWVLVDDCAVEVKTSDLKDHPDDVVNKVNEFCGLALDNVGTEKAQ